MASYPSRYRIEERGRRLVTIDTRTGQEYGADPVLGPAPVSNQPMAARTAAPPASKNLTTQRSALSALTVAPISKAAPQPMLSTKLKPDAAGKLIALMAGALLLAVFLIMTNLWIIVVIALTIAPVRSAALSWGKAALAKYLNQAATG